MTILPIGDITEIDQPIFGTNLLNLAKLKRAGFRVPLGIAISPPEILLVTVLRHLERQEKEVFEQKLTIIKKEVVKISQPSELEKATKSHKNFLINGRVVGKNELWLALLGMWLTQIRARLWQGGFTLGISSNLSSIPIFFISKLSVQVNAYFDPEQDEVIINCAKKLDPLTLSSIDKLVMDANKKLFIPQSYKFIFDDKNLCLVEVTPFTQTLPVSKEKDIVMPKSTQKQIIRSSIKLFVNLSSGFTMDDVVDGVLLEGENIGDFEAKVFKLAETALNFPSSPIIFKLPDIKDNEKIRGTLRLLNNKTLLDEACEAFIFSRNKKNLYNLELAIPYLRSALELLQIKRELSSKEINRKGSLKFWMEVATPENLINLDDYIAVGIDGVILNLDSLQKLLGGYDFEEGEFYKKEVGAIVKFITPAFKTLHKEKIPVLVMGSLISHPDILDCLVENGVWGVVVNTSIEADGLGEHLNWAEKRMVMKRLS